MANSEVNLEKTSQQAELENTAAAKKAAQTLSSTEGQSDYHAAVATAQTPEASQSLPTVTMQALTTGAAAENPAAESTTASALTTAAEMSLTAPQPLSIESEGVQSKPQSLVSETAAATSVQPVSEVNTTSSALTPAQELSALEPGNDSALNFWSQIQPTSAPNLLSNLNNEVGQPQPSSGLNNQNNWNNEVGSVNPGMPNPFGQPYTDATINSFQTTDPTIASALSLAAPDSFGESFDAPPMMSASGFSQFEQNVVSNYNNYSANGSLTENANKAAVLNSSLAGLSANDAAAATSAINAAVNAPYEDSAIQSFFLSDRPIANALQSAEPDMTSQGFSQFETNLASNYANAVDGTQTASNVEVMNDSTVGLSAGDSAAASSAISSVLNAPYFDEKLNDIESGPTLVQTLSDAEPNMTLQGFSQFENSIVQADDNAHSTGATLNDASVVAQATAGLSPADAAAASNAYTTALNYSGQVVGSDSAPTLSAGPYSDNTTTVIGWTDPKLANTISAAEATMTPVGFGQFEADAQTLLNAENTFTPNNSAIIAGTLANLSTANQTAVEKAYAAASG